MADGSTTLSPASIWFVLAEEPVFNVTSYTIEEPINGLFEVVVHATSDDGTIDPAGFIGRGAGFRFRHHAGDIIRSGVCSEAAQVRNQPTGPIKQSTYRFVIVPALFRTTLRRNSRNFQNQTVPQIVSKILGEWEIPFDDKNVKEPHFPHEYRVQYDETDFAFLSRLLEEEGISYWFDHAIKSGAGATVTSVIFSDQPQLGTSLGAFEYRQTGKHKTFQDGENVIFDLLLTQKLKVGKATIRDFDLRLKPHLNLSHTETGEGALKPELEYEDYQYLPGAFRVVGPGDTEATPTADSPMKVRTVTEQRDLRTKREIGAARHGQTTITFHTSALEWAPGDVLVIGNGKGTHPSPQVGGKKVLVTHRTIFGTTKGIRQQRVEAMPANVAFRPERKTPKARVFGLQSALVVGPKDQEIHTDELGRVRVQFHWDREHGYDEKSSCWLRVSQGWAGSGFGLIALPRVGHEVLVGFYDGDPDRPVVAGRVFNRRNAPPETLATHKTKSGWRTQSSGGSRSHSSRGYNELMFDDAIGKEFVSLRAQKNLSTLVKAEETRNIGGARSTRIGEMDVTHVGKSWQTLVGATTGMQMSENGQGDILLSTGKASIRLSGDNIYVEAEGNLLLNTHLGLQLSSKTLVDVVGGPEIRIACDEKNADKTGGPPQPTAAGPAGKPGGGPEIPGPFFPNRSPVPPPPPLGFSEIHVKNEKEHKPTPAERKALAQEKRENVERSHLPHTMVTTDTTPPAIPTGGPEYYKARADDFMRRHPGQQPPDYYMGYGFKYATRFMEVTKDKLTPEGQAWLYRTRENLQVAIEQKRAEDPDAFDALEQDNDAFRRFAYDSHPKAYVSAGLLNLPAQDLYHVSMTPDVSDLLSKDGIKQVGDVALMARPKDVVNVVSATASTTWNSITKSVSDWWGN